MNSEARKRLAEEVSTPVRTRLLAALSAFGLPRMFPTAEVLNELEAVVDQIADARTAVLRNELGVLRAGLQVNVEEHIDPDDQRPWDDSHAHRFVAGVQELLEATPVLPREWHALPWPHPATPTCCNPTDRVE